MIDHLSSKFCAAAELACNVSIAETAAIIITRMTASQTTKCKQRDNAEDTNSVPGAPRTPGIKAAFCALVDRSIRSRSPACSELTQSDASSAEWTIAVQRSLRAGLRHLSKTRPWNDVSGS